MSILIIAVVVLAIIAAVWLMTISINHNQKQKEQARMLKQFNRLAAAQRINLSSQEVLNGTIMGLDGLQRKLLVMKKRGRGTSLSKLIDLSEVTRCSAVRYYRPFISGAKKNVTPEEQLEKIVLRFQMNEGTAEEVVFYSHYSDPVLEATALANKARHWETLITKLQGSVRQIA